MSVRGKEKMPNYTFALDKQTSADITLLANAHALSRSAYLRFLVAKDLLKFKRNNKLTPASEPALLLG